MKHMALSVLMALTVVVFFAPGAFPDTITWTDMQYEAGTGFGNITNVLSLANKTSETGSVYPTSQTTGDATNSSKTWTVTQLVGLGFSANNLGIVFNINEPGSADAVNLERFSLDFYNGSGDSLGQTFLTGTPFDGLTPIGGNGTGTAGYLMAYNNTGFLTDFFNTGTNVLGGSGSVTDSFSGAENFYLARTDLQSTIIPEASAVFLFGSGLVGLVAYRRKRRMA
jgi:hypothetical protein